MKNKFSPEDPEGLTHYLGNDDYRNGTNVNDGMREEDEFPVGFSANGNDLEEDEVAEEKDDHRDRGGQLEFDEPR